MADNTTGSSGFSSNSLAALSVVQALSGAYSAYSAGREAEKLAKFNARMLELKAEDAKKRGQERANIARQRTKKLIGSQRANFAAQGVRVGRGSALDLTLEAQDIGDVDAMTIKNNARREAFGFQSEGIGARLRGELAEIEGTSRATDTILTGAVRAGSILRTKR